jgi:hypothetical protein
MSGRILYKNEDLVGKEYHLLTILEKVGTLPKEKGGHLLVKYQCKCGTVKVSRFYSIKQGKTISCGCFNKSETARRSLTHGFTINRKHKFPNEYNSWWEAKDRCQNDKNPAHHYYGGRGIKICERWTGKDGFKNFMDDMGERPSPKNKYSIDRINNDGNYEPGNCKWATATEQVNNKRYSGKCIEKICTCCSKVFYCSKSLRNKAKVCSSRCYSRNRRLKEKNLKMKT